MMKKRQYNLKWDHKFIYELSKTGISNKEICKVVGKNIKPTTVHQIVMHERMREYYDKKLSKR